MNKAEEDFIEQYSRVLLVNWCVQTLDVGHITAATDGNRILSEKMAQLCLTHAIGKGWVGKSEPQKVLAKGFATAAAFLKR